MFLVVAVGAYAQRVTIKAPSHVEVGQQFYVEYIINTQDVGDFHLGKVSGALERIGGPSRSTQSSWQMVNGHTSSSSTVTVGYPFVATKKGNATIAPSHVQIGGKTVATSPIHINVVGNGGAHQSSASTHAYHNDPQPSASASQIGSDELFIRTIVNKKRVHVQEPILLTYKVYTLVVLSNLDEKMPDLKGFHSQKIKLDHPEVPTIETINGRNYRCYTWSQYVMYPQMTGELEIPSITFHGVVTRENRNIDPFEAFLDGNNGLVEVRKDIQAPSVTIQVDPLPNQPEGYSGGVGKFNISSQLDKKTLKAGDPLTLRVVVSGTGNLKLIKQPVVPFPKEFETYDAKVTDKTRLTANGVEGNMVYDFLAVPRKEGKYTIPAVQFIYYDTSTNSYKTVKTQPYQVEVEPGDGTSSQVDDFTASAAQDIRPLKTGKASQHNVDDYFWGSALYWVVLALLVALFAAMLYVFRRRAIENANIVKMKGKNANKVATKRLHAANDLLNKGEKNAFYDEVLRALWGYVSDKLNMPVEELSRDNISEKLSAKGVADNLITVFIEAIDECEFERYAPGDEQGNMSRTFDKAMTAIMDIENAMKQHAQAETGTALAESSSAKPTLLLAALLSLSAWFAPQTAEAITKANADTEFQKGNYKQAIVDYQELLKSGVSPELYYNLGNAYYRSDNITQAVLAYERALLLSPGDDDIRFNLQMARSKTIDKITPESEMFFVTWYRSLVNLTSVDGWAFVAILSMLLVIALVMMYLFSERVVIQKIGFFAGIFFVVLFILANVFAGQQRNELLERNGAIVVSPSANVRETPATNSTSSFVIHEGTRVEIIDKTMNDWRNIRLADGREGWVKTEQIEVI